MARIGAAAHALDAVERVLDARDKQSLIGEITRAFAPFGFDGFAIARLPDKPTSAGIEVQLTSWPADWVTRYLKAGYCGIDPVVRHARRTTEPFLWSEAEWDPQSEPRALRMMDDAREFGLSDGFAVPILATGGNLDVVSLSGSATALTTEVRHAIRLIAIYARHRAMWLAGRSIRTRPGTRRRSLQ